MKLHRFESTTVAKAYMDNSNSNRFETMKLAYLVIALLIIANIIKMAIDQDGLLQQTWWIQVVAIVFFLINPFLRMKIKHHFFKKKGVILFIYDMISLAIYLALNYGYKYLILTSDYSQNVIMIDSYLVLIYNVLFSMKIRSLWNSLICLVGINVIDIVISLLYFPDVKLSYLINIFAVVSGELFIAYHNEISRRKNFEREFNLKEADSNFKQVLTILSEGILLFDRRRNIKYCNEPLFNIMGKEPQTPIENFKNLNALDLEHLIFNKKHKACNITGKGDFRKISTDKLEYKNLYKRMTTSKNCKQLIDFILDNWDEYCEVLLRSEIKYVFEGQTHIQGLEPLTLEVTVSFENFNNRASCLMMFSNVTDKNKIRDLEKTIIQKDRILATVSHELRAPLNGIINFTLSAIESKDCPAQIINEFLTPVVRSARYLMTMINDILDLAQLKADSLKLNPVPKSLVSTIYEALELIEIQAKKKKLTVTTCFPGKTWDAYVTTDHYRLVQILVNLLSNALKFTFKGGITVSVTETAPKFYQIAVEDTGIGIKDSDKDKLFQDFGKIDFERKTEINPSGVGLGLVISNSLAYLLGTKAQPKNAESIEIEKKGIYFESEYGVGSKFYFYIYDQVEEHPVKDPNLLIESFIMSAPSERDGSVDPLISTSRYDYTIMSKIGTDRKFTNLHTILCHCPDVLIVDDDSFGITILERMFTNLNYTVEHCFNGLQAIDIVKERINNPCGELCKPFKLILIDSVMPVMNGIDCCIEIQKLFAEKPNCKSPLIACTGNGMQTEIDLAKNAGFIDYCVKPVSSVMIKEICKKYINAYS